MRNDIYNHKLRLQQQIDRLAERGLCDEACREIRRFADQCVAEGLSKARITKYVYILGKLSQMGGKPFETWDRQVVTDVVRQVESSDRSPWSKHEYKVALKKLFRWLRGTDDEYPPEVRWIRTTIGRQHRRLPDELLTEEEVLRMVDAADTQRDRALAFTLYESGCRIGELAPLELRHVVFDKHGAQLMVAGKTGARRVRVVSAVPDLARWVNTHPLRDDPTAPLWVNLAGCRRNQPMVYEAIRKALVRLGAQAGITKRVHPHLFRHSRATHLASHLTEAQMKEHFGWVQGSNMAATYVHLSGRDVDGALLKLHGVTCAEETTATDALKPRVCSRCRSKNSPAARYCSQCRMPLDPKEIIQLQASSPESDPMLEQLLSDPEVEELLRQKLAALNGTAAAVADRA